MKKAHVINNRAAIYARYSSENQRDESIDAQVRLIEGYAKQNGYDIVKVFADKAKSATSDHRPEFQKMITESALDLFDVVIIHKLDRFSRDRFDSALYKRKLKKNGIRLISVVENLDGSPESIVLESVLEGMAEYYSKNLAREVMKGMSENAYKCMHTGGTPPLGYDVDPSTKKYVINETEAIAVREIFRLYNDGYGYERIMAALNEKGYKTKKGRPFGKNSLHEIIANEKFCGVYVFNRSSSKSDNYTRNNHECKDNEDIIRIPGGVPAIISAEEFEKARQRMIANKHSPGSYKAKESYLLSGLIFCGECGHRMTGNMRYSGRNKSKYVSYKCGYRENNKGCDNKELRKEYIEGFVLSELERLIFTDEAIPLLLKKLKDFQKKKVTENSQEFTIIQAKLQETNAKLDNIINAVANGYLESAFKEKMSEFENQKVALETRLREIHSSDPALNLDEASLRIMISQFKRFVQEKNIPECKKFIQSFVDRVVVYKEHVEVTLKVTSNFSAQNECLTMKTEEKIKTLFRRFKVA